MKLEQIKLKNFRVFSDEQTLDVENSITAVVGKNDAGKSSVLEALDKYFNNVTPDIDDLNVQCGDDEEIAITCVFGDLPETITVDSTADTTLQQEYMVNEDGKLEISKVFSCTAKTVKKDPEVYIRCLHPTVENYDDLLTLKNEDLKKRAKELDVKSPDDRANNEIRKTVWEKASDLSLQRVSLSYNDLSDKFQTVYGNLEKLFPEFFIFRVDRQTVDSDSEAKDPIQVAVKEAKKQLDPEIRELEQKIANKAEFATKRALEKLHEMDSSLADKLTPEFKQRPRWTFDFKINDHRGVPLNKRGSGTRRLVLLNFFRAEAERGSSSEEANIIYAIEEPETSQHPNNQETIIRSLLELAGDDKRQVIISTHSAELVDKIPRSATRFIDAIGDRPAIINGEQGLLLAADSLGTFSPQKLGSAKKLVLAEGVSDCTFLEHASTKLKEAGVVDKDFNDEDVLVLPLGGKEGIKNWIKHHKAENLGLKYYILLDSDRCDESSPETENEVYVDQLIADDYKAHVTRKKEIENYIDPSVSNTRHSDFDNAKNIISQENSVPGTKVVDTYWTQMTSEQMIAMSNYKTAQGDTKSEIEEIIADIINM